MRTRILSSVAVAVLFVGACGGGGKQGEAADMLLDAAEEEGFELDADCVEEVAGDLSDEDAEKIVDAGPDGDVQLSADGEALADEMLSCVDTDALVDTMIADLVAEYGDENVDANCLKDALSGLDLSDPDDASFGTGVLDCVDFGG